MWAKRFGLAAAVVVSAALTTPALGDNALRTTRPTAAYDPAKLAADATRPEPRPASTATGREDDRARRAIIAAAVLRALGARGGLNHSASQLRQTR